MSATDDVEISTAVADAIASWRRVFAGRNGASAHDLLRKAAADLWESLEIDRTVHPDSHIVARQETIDALQEMAELGGIGPDDAQLIFAESFNGKSKANGHGAESENERSKTNNGGAELLSRNAANIMPEKIDWLWTGRLARGKHSCIAGEPGTGKSQLSIYITGIITSGGDWPCDEGQAPRGSVIILSAEDGAADTIIPRLMAVGADLNRVHLVSAVRHPKGRRNFSLQTDIQLLEQKITEVGDVALVIIDPVSSYLGATDSHKNAEVRGVLEPLSEMAERTRCSVLSITHFNKTTGSNTTKALHRFIGSIAFTGAPRAAFALIEDPDDRNRRLFLFAKGNVAPPSQGLAFRLEQTIVADGIVGSRVAWEGEPVSITANQALAAEAAGTDKRSALAEAEDFLRDILASGPVPATDVQEAARASLITNATLRRAKDKLKIEIMREGFGPGSKVLWSHRCSSDPIDAHPQNMSTYGENEHLWKDGRH